MDPERSSFVREGRSEAMKSTAIKLLLCFVVGEDVLHAYSVSYTRVGAARHRKTEPVFTELG